MNIQQRILTILALDKKLPKDCVPRFRWRLVVLVLTAAVLILVEILSAFPNFVERVYSRGIDPGITVVLGRMTAIFPFSVAEILVWLLLLYLLVSAARALYFVVRRQRRLRNAILNGVVRLLTISAILLLFFYTNWGINFDRPNLIKRMQWDKAATELSPKDLDELIKLDEELVRKVNDFYRQINHSDDIGHPTALPDPIRVIDDALEEGYKSATLRLGLQKTFATRRGPAKPVICSFVMSDFLILGMYTPWTGEANYNREITPCALPQVMGHEKAHQHCVTSEDEANFLGFIACIYSDNRYAQYSGYLFAQRQLLIELIKVNPDRAKALIAQRLPGVQKDVDAINAFTRSHAGRVSTVGRAFNNAYLKANGVQGGVMSYQMSSRLLVVFSRVNGGTCVLGGGKG